MCTLTAFGLQPMHYLYALWKMCLTNLSLSCSSRVSLLSLSLAPFLTLHRPGGAGGGHLSVEDPGGGAVRTGGLLVPVCGLELSWHHQEQPRLRSHCMSVSRRRVCTCCTYACERQWESKRKRNSERANVFNFLLVTRVSLSIYANKLP